MLLGENDGVARSRGRFTLLDRKEMENYLGRYSGLILYLKEMDEGAYARLCAVCNPLCEGVYGTHASLGLLLSVQPAPQNTDQCPSFAVRCRSQERPGRGR